MNQTTVLYFRVLSSEYGLSLLKPSFGAKKSTVLRRTSVHRTCSVVFPWKIWSPRIAHLSTPMVALISLVSAHGRVYSFPWEQEGLDDTFLLPPPLHQACPCWVVPEATSPLSGCRWDSGNRIFFGPDCFSVAIWFSFVVPQWLLIGRKPRVSSYMPGYCNT